MAWACDPTFNFSTWVVASVLFFTIFLSIYAYGFLTFAKNFYTILRNDLKKSRFWKIPALISAVWYELAGVLLLPIVIKKKRWAGLLFILLSFVFGFLGYMLDTPLQKWWCFHFGVPFMLFGAIAAIGKKGDYQRKAAYPLFGFALFGIILLASDFYFYTQIQSRQRELAQVTQCGIGAANWQKRNASGYSIDKEPLKSFCKINMKIDMEKYQTPEEAKKYLAELRKTQADKFIAIDKLLKLKPQRFAYNWVAPGETVAYMLLPDLQCFLTAAHLRILEIRANGADKNVVAVPRMARYMEVSAKIYSVYLKYVSPDDIHVYSIDEVFIDATSYLKLYKLTARDFAMKLIRDVLQTTGITATAGIGPNMYLCKIADLFDVSFFLQCKHFA